MGGELFSERLKRYRSALGLSQEDAGKLLGVSGRYVGMIERGDKEVEQSSSLAKLFALLERNLLHPHDPPAPLIHVPHHGTNRDTGTRVAQGTALYAAQRLKDTPLRTANDAEEITGLAALVQLHAARVQAGEKQGDLPTVRRALEAALESRGVLPRQEP